MQMTTGKFFREVSLPEQKSFVECVRFPAVLSPTIDTDLTAFEEAIRAEKPWLESLFQKSGVIIFRGFPVFSPSDFNDVVEAFGFPEAQYVGGRAPRTKVVGRIYTANESPMNKRIPFHHEMNYVNSFFIYSLKLLNLNCTPSWNIENEKSNLFWFSGDLLLPM